MKEVVYYVAEDGTKFDDDDKCLAYEKNILWSPYINQIHFFNSKIHPVSTTFDNLSNGEVFFIKVDTDEAAVFLQEEGIGERICTPFSDGRDSLPCLKGYYWYDDNQWKNLDIEIGALQEKKFLMGV